jgi:hypothetical protein
MLMPTALAPWAGASSAPQKTRQSSKKSKLRLFACCSVKRYERKYAAGAVPTRSALFNDRHNYVLHSKLC